MSFTIKFGPFNASLKNKIIVIKIILTPNWHCIYSIQISITTTTGIILACY